ncbi:hypothetical protein GGS26DRAFT_319218 [Hypomontagnella submonticulosa]|nr:hypothetical protein GGS26DRAFT_319218 [Hypomontagnella submonticulosa]
MYKLALTLLSIAVGVILAAINCRSPRRSRPQPSPHRLSAFHRYIPSGWARTSPRSRTPPPTQRLGVRVVGTGERGCFRRRGSLGIRKDSPPYNNISTPVRLGHNYMLYSATLVDISIAYIYKKHYIQPNK